MKRIITHSIIAANISYNSYNEVDYSKKYFTIEALEDGLRVQLSHNVSQYRIDNGEWISLDAETTTPLINNGQTIQFRITNPTIAASYGIGAFTINKKCNISGNIMSLLYGDNFERQIDLSGKRYAFYKLFNNCTTLQGAENLILPATTLEYRCYYSMFDSCTSLKTATSVLPATTLADYCYECMFRNCTSLTTAPELPATILANGCYRYMFYKCSKLNYIKMLATDISASGCLTNWVSGVATTGTFVKHPQMTSLLTATLDNSFSGIPEGWTVVDYVEQ